ncbi:MAG: DoxX family protein [Mycobacteriaceae bacterium]|nr:DoxX family protein [Mycobacteriaceae bacterium]MBV9641455.1 DoxX family protein [Mycobacteriaceae bacterium]
MQIAVVLVSIGLAVFFAIAAILNIFYLKPSREDATHLGISSRLTRFIGLCQIAAVFGLLAGLFWRPLAIAAATGVLLLLVGAVIAHRRVGDPIARMMRAVVVFVLTAFVLAGHIWLLT